MAIDQKTGVTTLTIADDFGAVRDLNHGLVNGSAVHETWSIHPDDPLSASMETQWTQTLSRDGWSVRTETYSRMRSDETSFHLYARIEAYEDEKLIFERDFRDAVPRNLV